MNHFRIYLILSPNDWTLAKTFIPYIRKNIASDGITVVSSKKLQGEDLCGCDFLDEDEILNVQFGLSLQTVSDYLSSIGAKSENAG